MEKKIVFSYSYLANREERKWIYFPLFGTREKNKRIENNIILKLLFYFCISIFIKLIFFFAKKV